MKIPNTSLVAKTTLLSILSLAGLMFLAPTILQPASADGGSSKAPTFSNYELAGNPFTTGASVGTTCPNTLRTCMNTEEEPSIRAAPDGSFYGSSENVFCVLGGQCGGTFAYKSTDGGQHFTTLPLPNSASSGRIGFSPAGGDTDIAVAPSRNLNGFFNVYVASLATSPPLANVYVSTSKDGGNSWLQNPTGASIPVDDREWIAADGADKVCVSYHAISATNDIFVTCSLNGGTTFTQTGNAFDPAHVAFLAGFNNVIGNLAIDPRNHVVYQVFSSVANAAELAQCTIFCHVHTVWVAVSTDGGLTFTDTIVYNNPNTNLDYGHQFINVSVDIAGNVYAVYSDNHNIFYSFSKTLGQTWYGHFQINIGQSKTDIFPWSSAVSDGALDVVWYGTNYFDGVNPPDNYPMTAAWKVYFSQNLIATTPGSSWSQVAASGIIHYGGVCESGVTCTGNRDLLDDFGVAASPTTGLAAIIYTSDQFVNSTAEPATRRSASAFCTTNDTTPCSHTNIAIQTGGSTTNQKPHHFEASAEDFEELDVSNDGGHSPHGEIDITNTGTVAIDKFDVRIGGLPWTLAWSSTAPLQPGQSIQGTSSTVPLGLVLIVGNIYPVTITATLADGTTETQTTNVIYSLGAGLGL